MTIRIQHLEFDAIIGLHDFERDRTQRVLLDIEATYDYQPPAFLDYAQMVEVAKKHVIDKKYELLEEALHGLRDTLLETFPQIKTLDISIAKPDILPDCVVTISSD